MSTPETPNPQKRKPNVLSDVTLNAMCEMYDRRLNESTAWMVVVGATKNGEYLSERKLSIDEALELKLK